MRLILFDVGGVIIRADHLIGIRAIEALGVPSERAKLFFENEGYSKFGRGEFTGWMYYEYLVREVLQDQALMIDDVRTAYDNHMYAVDRTVIDMIRSLRYPVAFATDTNEWQTQREMEMVPLTALGTDVHIVRSHEIGILKRDRGGLYFMVGELGVDPKDVVYIDDVPEYVKKVRKFGGTAFQFTSAAQLYADLRSVNVL